MLNLMDRAFQPSTSIQDLTVYLTSVRNLQTISTNEQQVSEKIKNLLSTTKTRLQGLILLQVALEQSPDIFFKGNWLVIIFKTLEDPASKLLKELACNIMCIAIKILSKHPPGYDEEIKKCKSFLFPFLLDIVESNSEWADCALELLLTCLKYFGRDFEGYKDNLMRIIISSCARTTSSKTFELYADCFSVLPACMRNQDLEDYQDSWFSQYITTLKTMICTLNTLFFHSDDSDEDSLLEEVPVYPVDYTGDEVFSAYMKNVRLFVNLCKCLTKMLSSKSLFPVKVPIKITLNSVCRLFRVNEINKLNTANLESQLYLSTVSQLQIAGLELLEPLLLNFNMSRFKYNVLDIMVSALRSSTLSIISSETICPIRHIVWKLLNIWMEVNSVISGDIVQNTELLDELLKDISAEDVPVQATGQQSRSKSKKNTSAIVGTKINFMNNNRHIVCIEALEVLRNILYCAGTDISGDLYQDLFSKVVSATKTVLPQLNPPFPYDDARCRKNLYTVLLAIAVNSKSDQRDIFTTSFGILQKASRDPSSKVASLHQQINVMSKTIFHPKKPLPLFTSLENRQKRPDISNAIPKFSGWSVEEDPYVPNIPPVEKISNVAENVTPQISQTFHNPADSEMPPNDFVVDTHYSEAAAENRCNGDDILELPNSSQCQEDAEESDEDEEEEEEDEDDEMNQEMDIQTEHMYIPSSGDMQVLNPVHINPETVHPNVSEQEYEELGPCAKSQANVVDNKSQQNGARIVPDEMQSESTQNIANANGIYASEDEEMDEEEGEEDEEEEEVTFPTEKKIPVFSESPAKMPKLENENEVKSESQEEEMDQRSRSPTLAEMKADFHYCEVEDAKS